MSTTDKPMVAINPRSDPVTTRDQSLAVFSRVMGLVALTVACAALGAYIGRDLSGGTGLLFFIAAIVGLFGLELFSGGRD